MAVSALASISAVSVKTLRSSPTSTISFARRCLPACLARFFFLSSASSRSLRSRLSLRLLTDVSVAAFSAGVTGFLASSCLRSSSSALAFCSSSSAARCAASSFSFASSASFSAWAAFLNASSSTALVAGASTIDSSTSGTGASGASSVSARRT